MRPSNEKSIGMVEDVKSDEEKDEISVMSSERRNEICLICQCGSAEPVAAYEDLMQCWDVKRG